MCGSIITFQKNIYFFLNKKNNKSSHHRLNPHIHTLQMYEALILLKDWSPLHVLRCRRSKLLWCGEVCSVKVLQLPFHSCDHNLTHPRIRAEHYIKNTITIHYTIKIYMYINIYLKLLNVSTLYITCIKVKFDLYTL